MRVLARSVLLVVAVLASTAFGDDVDFSRDVRPILSDKCYACHGPDKEHREGGNESQGGLHFDTKQGAFADLGGHFAIVPKQSSKSELIRRINSADPDNVMPPSDHRRKLTAREKQILTDWIAQGAKQGNRMKFRQM